jgi:Protein of unknown function (DUF1236)
VGGLGGLLGVEQVPRFHDNVIIEHRSSYRYSKDRQVGMILPSTGVIYYQVIMEFGVLPRYRYTIVNQHVILVDPRTRRVVQIID